jgi:integrase
MISWEELKNVLDQELERLILAEQNKLRRSGPYPLMADNIWKHDTIPNYQKAIQTITELRNVPITGIHPEASLPSFAENLTDNILQKNNIKLDKSSDLFLLFCEATVRIYLEFTQQRIQLNDDALLFQVNHPQPVPATPLHTSPFPVQTNYTPISEVVETYCIEMVKGGNWTAKTETEYRAAYKLLIKITNDMPIALVDHLTAQFFKATMQKLPSNMNKKPLYRDKTIQEVAAMKVPKEDLLSITKINSYMGRLSQFFIWAGKNGYTSKNPFSGIGIKNKVLDHEKRGILEDSDIKALFSTPVFKKGDYKHPHYYWLPLLGAYTGARLNELCQLYLDDLYQIDDLWVFDFNEDLDKRLKTPSSKRIIPIHTSLIDLGLIEYATYLRKKGHVRLFPELKKGRDGYGTAASKWFARYRHKCGVEHDLKDFHSFRHTVIEQLKKNDDVIKEKTIGVVGHKDSSITTGTYGKPYKPHELITTVEAINFPIEVIKFHLNAI